MLKQAQPAINPTMLLAIDPYSKEDLSRFSKIAMEHGLGLSFSEGVFRELQDLQKSAKLKERNYLQYLREELRKMSAVEENPTYSDEELDHITSSLENFQKAAALESEAVWNGLKDELLKSGADEDFIEGIRKEAMVNFFKNVGRSAANAAKNMLGHGGAEAEAAIAKRIAARGVAADAARAGGATLGDSVPGGFLRDAGGELWGAGEHAAKPKALHKSYNELENLQAKQKLGPLTSEELAQHQNILDMHDAHYRANQEKALKNKTFELAQQSTQRAPDGVSFTPEALNAQKILSDMHLHKNFTGFMGHIGADPAAAADFAHAAAGGYAPKTYRGQALHQDAINEAMSTAAAMRTGGYNPQTAAAIGKQMNPNTVIPHYAPMNSKPGFWERAGSGALGGSLLGAPFGVPFIGAGLGAGVNAIGKRNSLLAAGALGAYGLHSSIAKNNTQDITGAPVDRNRLVPYVKNNWAGGIGGALLGALIAGEMSRTGRGNFGILLPILGGIAGWHYLPEIMNKWKDPYGEGVNSIHPGAAAVNSSYPISSDTNMQPASAVTPTPR